MEERKPIRVAIVGSGMAGLVTAYLLHRDRLRRYEVTVFESGKTLSLDSASVSLPRSVSETDERIDLPMRAFAGGYYNNLKAMYDFLGVRYKSQPFLFEFARTRADQKSHPDPSSSYFIHASNLHQMPPPRPKNVSLFAYLVEVVNLLACYAWFSFCCIFIAPRAGPGRMSESLNKYLKRICLPEYFVTYYLLPLMSSVTTCPHETLLAFPASDLTEYKRMTNGAPHYTVLNGVKGVQEKLARGIDYKLSAVVSAVRPTGNAVKIDWHKDEASRAEVFEDYFDRVVLAVAPDVVSQVFDPLGRAMRRIPTINVRSVVHIDKRHFCSATPQRQEKADDSAQLIYLRTSTEPIRRTESIHVQPCGALVTTCPFTPIDSGLEIQSASFTRVLRTPESQQIVNSIFSDTYRHPIPRDEKSVPPWKNGDGNVWLVGGWCWDGMVLLEGCVVSAMIVADAFGVEIPWRK
jgi:hypothetical protein